MLDLMRVDEKKLLVYLRGGVCFFKDVGAVDIYDSRRAQPVDFVQTEAFIPTCVVNAA